jgi:hypothetical protein
MVRRYLTLPLLVAAIVFAGAAPAPHYITPPPGIVVQDVTAYLSGEGMNSAWHAVSSRVLVGHQMGKEPAYQWFLSIYAPSANGLKLVYQLPSAEHHILSRVEQAHGAEMYFPVQQLRIAGAGELEQSGVQDLVIQTHEFAADCGESTVAVLGTDQKEAVVTRAQVTNGCDLSASIVKNGSLQAVQLTGPYYGPKAPLCCPTEAHATAMLSFANGRWSVTPKYFTLAASQVARR